MAANRGQPTKYTVEFADKICELISTHTIGLPRIIAKYNLPDRQTIYNWIHTYPDFFDKYMKAKEMQAHILVDESLEITSKIPTLTDKEGNERIDSGMIGRARLDLENIRWVASTLAPRHYSDSKQKEAVSSEISEDTKKRYRELDERNRKNY